MISNSKYKHIALFMLIIVSLPFSTTNAEDTSIITKDTLTAKMEQNLLSLIELTPSALATNADSVKNEEVDSYFIYNRLVMPLQFSKAFPDNIWRIQTTSIFDEMPVKFDSLQLEKRDFYDEYAAIDSVRQAILHSIIFEHPNWVESIQTELPKDFVVKRVDNQRDTFESLQTLFNQEIALPKKFTSRASISRFNNRGHWITANKAAAQFSQNYISSNWQQGGESNLSMNSILNMKANYVHPRGWSFYNEIDWRTSFFTTPSDTMRVWRVSDDLFRVSSNFAIKAFEKWNYSVSSEFKTRLFDSYQTNTVKKLGSFLSPAEFAFSIGMSYENNFDKHNIKGFSLLLSPFSYNWKYVLNSKVDVTRFGITKGQSTLNQIGSRCDVRLNYNMTKNVVWTTRFYYFTSYKNVESEWENTFNFIINRYFSTRVFFHLKYDDKRTLPKGETSYYQFKELLSFGLNYSWN